jgi:ABC-type uncharacterized transport system substrate-binding protein
MGRARILAALLAAVLLGALLTTQARAQRIARLGILATAPTAEDITRSSFLIKLKELGWDEGRNLRIERRFVSSPLELERSARELAALKLDVIYAPGAPSIRAAKQEITGIPIVIFSVGDPVRSGWVKNLARPEGNLTGVAGFSRDLVGKRVALLKEAVPAIRRVAVLGNPVNANLRGIFLDFQERAAAIGLEVRLFEVSTPAALEPAFAAMASEKMQGLMEVPDPMFLRHSKEVVEMAERNGLPTIFEPRQYADAGGLMAYGADYEELARRAAVYVDRLLRGAKPGELPIEFPTRFELVLNLRTARALGITIPQSVLLRADRVIE